MELTNTVLMNYVNLVIKNDVGESGPIRRFVSKGSEMSLKEIPVNVITYTRMCENICKRLEFVTRLNFKVKLNKVCLVILTSII